MPKNRNRTVKNNFEFPPEFLKTLPYPEKVNANGQKPSVATVARLGLGEPISSQYCNNHREGERSAPSSSSEYDIASGVSDLDIISFGKSSSSSISWSDELDTEATQRVQNELERMERVLQGKEAIPAHYNRDEYEQWIKTFPQLSVSGSKMKYPVHDNCLNINSNTNDEEILAFHSDLSYLTGNCDSDPTSSELKKIDNLKNTVIDQVFKSISSKLLNRKSIKKTNNAANKDKNRQSELLNPYNSSNSLASQFDSFLRISPVLLQETPNKPYRLDTRQQSSQSISRSERLASKWMREEPLEYSSLPYLSAASAKNKSRKTIERKNSTSSKPRYSTKLSPHKNNYISLPPIKTLSIPSANQYRSISATPRQPAKGLSAVSIQLEKSRIEVANYLAPNEIESRKKIVKHSK